MTMTIMLAEMLGIILSVSGLSMLVNKKSLSYLMEEISRNKGFLWLTGFFILVFGSALVSLSNVWNSGLESLVSLIAWLTLIKGAVILLFPEYTVSLASKWNKASLFAFSGWAAFILGLILLYKGMM